MKITFEMKICQHWIKAKKKLETSSSVMLEKTTKQEKNEINKIVSMCPLAPNKNWGILKTPN